MKKIIALLMALVMVLGLAACGQTAAPAPAASAAPAEAAPAEAAPAEAAPAEEAAPALKAGFIFLHDETSTYDLNFMNAAKEACEKLGLQEGTGYIIKTNIPEGQECYDAAAELVDEGCNFVFAD